MFCLKILYALGEKLSREYTRVGGHAFTPREYIEYEKSVVEGLVLVIVGLAPWEICHQAYLALSIFIQGVYYRPSSLTLKTIVTELDYFTSS